MQRVAGLLLTIPFGLTAVLILVVGVVEKRNMFRPDAEAIATSRFSTSLGHLFGIIGIVSTLGGLALLTVLLAQAGSDAAPIVALVLFGLTTFLFVVDLITRESMGVWAAAQEFETGSAPEAWTIAMKWINVNANVYVTAGLLATVIYGVAILQTNMLPGWVGWLSIGWSTALLVLSAIMRGGIPGTLPIMPFTIGIVLLTTAA